MPAAVICTEEFVASATAQATICGNPRYPFAVVAHPIGSLTAAELRARAAVALPQVIAILTGT
ncbi:MAG TPA: UGSC family (seleno)protein, partial [Dongiaceae bacterium]|nr:UGSC family (seleno)protein [Dongiaceae bacterium]